MTDKEYPVFAQRLSEKNIKWLKENKKDFDSWNLFFNDLIDKCKDEKEKETTCMFCSSLNIIKRRNKWRNGTIMNHGLCLDCGIAATYNDENFSGVAFAPKKKLSDARGDKIKELKKLIAKRDGEDCSVCGASKDNSFIQLDHILPEMFGGTDDEDNLQLLCASCNSKKGVNLKII